MKKIIKFSLIILLGLAVNLTETKAQSDTLIRLCTQYLKAPFISDGQQYKALLNGDEIAEFHATFYGGSLYRVVGCSGMSVGNLAFSVYDIERNLLFTNKDYQNAPYWDFKFNSTIDCIIEAELDSKSLSSGFVLMLIGFKQ
ncbi:MAG: hypothetical protein A2W98_09965 [Bacteroidetes bacterium GWF2_33_38]|nr:MAG: hypothetical protein A2W98_09965 [Bacteroidetes bacterium GWF2_33_38]OFY75210.1 MAG: hypothetical protein A2265_11220 [Bacteroidetes bacterium RIFOXYA12_FULL_33_9]OFY91607.1 MAG: hypothetical protein A2236_11440 [Bacteroidetes bacterium RIFOXYA2_FULL_33_7]HBX52589.1 hypothetical protein [Bacteroidales bacterium]